MELVKQDTEPQSVLRKGPGKITPRRQGGGEGGPRSALVTGRALFCIELIGGNAKHVVALDAHAVKNGARDWRQLGRVLRCRRACLGARSFSRHRLILAREGPLTNHRHPSAGGEHLSSVWDAKKFLMKNASSNEPDYGLSRPVVIHQARFARCVYVRHDADRKPRGPG